MIIGTNFKLSSKKFLDDRQQSPSLNDLIVNANSILYPQGFEVYCIEEKSWYQNVSEGDTPVWEKRKVGTGEGGNSASIDDTKISSTTTWSSEYIYSMQLDLENLISQNEDYIAEVEDRLLYVEGRLTSIGSFDGSYDSLTNKPEFPSLENYVTKEYIDELIANIGKIEGTKDYNELINQPINNIVIEYAIDERLIANISYFEEKKWYTVNTHLNEEYNNTTTLSLVYYLEDESYKVINMFTGKDLKSLIYVNSITEQEINIIFISPSGGTYELIYNIESYSTIINPLSLSTNNTLTYTPTEDYHPATKKYVDEATKNSGGSGVSDYNDLENRPVYDDREKTVLISFDAKEMSDKLKNAGSFFVLKDGSFEINIDKDYSITLNGEDYPIDYCLKEPVSSIVYWYNFDSDTYPEDYFDNTYILYYWTLNGIGITVIPHTTIDRDDYLATLSYSENQYILEFYRDGADNYQLGEGLIEILTTDGELKQLDEKFIPDKFRDYNNLENKPCYDIKTLEEVVEFTFDGNLENAEVAYSNSVRIVRISEEPITFDEFMSAKYTVQGDGYQESYLVSQTGNDADSSIQFIENETGSAYFMERSYGDTVDLAVVYDDGFVYGGHRTEALSKGIWVMYYSSTAYYCHFEYPKYNYDFKQLDEKFIPDTIATKEYVDSKIGTGGSVTKEDIPHTITEEKLLLTLSSDEIHNNGDWNINTYFTTIYLVAQPIEFDPNKRYCVEFANEKILCNNVDIGGFFSGGTYYNTTAATFDGMTFISLDIVNDDNEEPIIDITDFKIYEEEVATLPSKYLPNNLTIHNAISLGRIGEIGAASSAMGYSVRASGGYSHAEGYQTNATNMSSHAEGENTVASGMTSHAEGSWTEASGDNSHAEGVGTSSIGMNSHAEGCYSESIGHYSHAEGNSTIAQGECQHTQGKYNLVDIENKYVHIVGNGESNGKRSNAHTLDWDGNAWYQGNITISGTPTEIHHLVTKKYVDNKIDNINMEEYITETELTNKGYLTEIPTDYITETELTNKGYVTETDLEEEMVFETDSLTVNPLGGISANTDLNGLTVKEILNKLLYPYIEPVITVSTTPNGSVFEKGNNQTITNVSVSITKKSEIITKIEVLNGTQVLARQQDEAINNGGTFNYNVNVSVPSTNKQLTVKVTDNSGNAITKTTNAFTFVYPYYYGICDEGATINGDLIKSLTKSVETKGTKAITYTTNNQRMIFAYPKSYGAITKILDPNSFDVTATFSVSQLSILGLDGTAQSYYIYVNNPSTVQNFKMTFYY